MLIEIFKFLPTAELLNCRLVNIFWNEGASDIYRDRTTTRFHFVHAEGFYQLCDQGSYGIKKSENNPKLSELTGLINSSPFPSSLPFSGFSFEFPLKMTQDLSDFLQVYGDRIKRLSLNCYEQKYFKKEEHGQETWEVTSPSNPSAG